MKILLERSSDVFKLVLSFGLVICVLVIVFEIVMAFGGTPEELSLMALRLTPILLLTGVLITAFLVIRTENALAISISVLIIGTVVAGDRFLLSLTALLTNQGGQGAEFVTGFYREGAASPLEAIGEGENRTEFAEEIVRALREAESKDQGEEAAVLIVEDFISRTQVAQIATRVTEVNAQQPLLRLYRSREAFLDFAAVNFGSPVFANQMEFLRAEGVLDYLSSDFTDVTLTSLGQQVGEALNRPFEISAPEISSVTISSADAYQTTDLSAVPTITSTQSPTAVPLQLSEGRGQFIRIDMEQSDFVSFETIDPSQAGFDTVLDLLAEDGTFIESNDDGGVELLSRIVTDLGAGTYYLYIWELNGWAGSVALEFKN